MTKNELINQLNQAQKLLEASNYELSELKSENELLREQVEYLKRKLFGTKSETSRTIKQEQLSFNLFDEAEKECDQTLVEEIKYKRRKIKRTKTYDEKFAKLPKREILLDLEEDEKDCPQCNKKLTRVGKEFVRREVELIPARIVVNEIYRTVYECRDCRKKGERVIVKPGVPATTIPHSYASAETVTHVISEKYIKSVPLYRQEQEWKRLGLELPRSTMANWVIIAANEYFIPLKKRMHEILIKEKYVHCDETTIQVLKEANRKATTKSYMWVYSSIKESKYPICIYDYKPTRSGECAEEFLKGFNGTAITDCYSGYNDIEGVRNAYCWAHARRKFVDSIPSKITDKDTLAHIGLKKINKLFAIEKEIEKKSAEEKAKIRQEKSKVLVEEFFEWCEEEMENVPTKSNIGKAFSYAIKHQEGLKVFIEDGYVPLTNNLDENHIRSFTIGRKNWLFSDSTEGAEASASIYSVIETAKANGLDAYEYIYFVLSLMPGQDIVNHPEVLDKFLPWSKEYKRYREMNKDQESEDQQ